MEKLYQIIQNELKAKILSGELGLGDKLPSESALCEEYNVSRISVRRALSDLEKSGFITQVAGKGSFVKKHNLRSFESGFYSLAEEIYKNGMTPGYRVLCFEKIKASEVPGLTGIEYRKYVNPDPDENVYFIRRLRLADDEIVALDNLVISGRFYNFDNVKSHMLTGDIFFAFRGQTQGTPDRGREIISARPIIDPDDIEALNVPYGASALCMSRIAYRGDQISDFTYRIYRGELYSYCFNLDYSSK